MLKKLRAVNRFITINKSKNNPDILSPAIYPLLVAFLPFLNPNKKNAPILNKNIIKLVIVELTPIKLSKLHINIRRIKNIE